MPDPFIGQIMMFAGNFAPRGWALCNGQLLSIAQNTALFSILGTAYGGDGRSTFALPDLRGRAPIHSGTGSGLSPRGLGTRGGEENVQLTVQQMPSHTHAARGSSAGADQPKPVGNVLAGAGSNVYSGATADVNMGASAIADTGGGQAHPNMQPFLTINFIIALVGVFPSRS